MTTTFRAPCQLVRYEGGESVVVARYGERISLDVAREFGIEPEEGRVRTPAVFANVNRGRRSVRITERTAG